MSTFIQKAINPKTGKLQVAIYQDDYYGNHRYGVGFRKDGKDYNFNDCANYEDLDFYKEELIKIKK